MAETVLDRALTLNPNSAIAWQLRGWIYALRKAQPEAAIEAFDRAQRLSPFDPRSYFNGVGLAMAHLVARHFEQAIEFADRTLYTQPRTATAIRVKIVACAHLGRLDEASEWLGRLLEILPGLTITRYKATFAAGWLPPQVAAFYETGMRKAGLPEE